MPPPLARIVQQLKREPSRTGSIVITVFGDAIVPRGGSVWLGTLLEFFRELDVDASVVRTAMSRLTADGWFERNKVGRNSFYRLVQSGRQTFDIATKHIYGPPASDWTGRFELLLIGNGGDRDAAREALRNAGFGSPLPGVWVAPSGVPVPKEASGAIRLEVSAEDDSGRRLLSESWPLHRTADAYQKFMKTFEPLRSWISRGERLTEADAFTARILLIHHYRQRNYYWFLNHHHHHLYLQLRLFQQHHLLHQNHQHQMEYHHHLLQLHQHQSLLHHYHL